MHITNHGEGEDKAFEKETAQQLLDDHVLNDNVKTILYIEIWRLSLKIDEVIIQVRTQYRIVLLKD